MNLKVSQSYEFAKKTRHWENKGLPHTFQWENLLNPWNLIKIIASKLLNLFYNQHLWKGTITQSW